VGKESLAVESLRALLSGLGYVVVIISILEMRETIEMLMTTSGKRLGSERLRSSGGRA